MGDSFFIYLEQLELMVFFSGYPLIYLLVRQLAETGVVKKYVSFNVIILLPYIYILTGVLYIGFQLKSLYPDYSIEHIRLNTVNPFLKIWGLSSIFFLIPALNKKPVLSFLHSLVFFFLLFRDLFFNIFSGDKSVVKNDMIVYTYSLLLNLSAFIITGIIYILIRRIRRRVNR